MFRIAVFILLLFAIAIGFAWLADNPGTVTVQWDWLNRGEAYEFGLATLTVVIAVLIVVIMFVWWMINTILNSPKIFGRWRAGRRRDRGYTALSKGLVAAGAGNVPLAKQLAKESGKLLESEPLVAMLDAQTALLEGDRTTARQQFSTMLDSDETRLLGLRGLYLEAEQEGELEAASHFAEEAIRLAPATPWASKAVLRTQALSGQWDNVLQTLEANRSSGLFDKQQYNRLRAVVLTAQALSTENESPDSARTQALAAHKLAPELVPAAIVAARLCVRLDDSRKAGKVLEATWRQTPHPEVADSFINLNPGDSPTERLGRAQKLVDKAPDHVESHFILAKASIDCGEFDQARKAIEIVLRDRPTEQACLIMADIEEAEHGDRGRVREWLSRAVTAPKDAIWMADGIASAQWAPCSPSTGKLDAFEWKSPMQELAASAATLNLAQWVNQPPLEVVELNPRPENAAMPLKKSSAADVETVDAEVIESTSKPVESDAAAEDAADAQAADSQADDEKPKSKKTSKATEKSPYTQTDLDADQDGIIDHRPDDPGITEVEEEKKGWMF